MVNPLLENEMLFFETLVGKGQSETFLLSDDKERVRIFGPRCLEYLNNERICEVMYLQLLLDLFEYILFSAIIFRHFEVHELRTAKTLNHGVFRVLLLHVFNGRFQVSQE